MIDKDQIRQQLFERAQELVPALRERAPEAEKLGYLPQATIDDFQEAGFFRILQPQKWEGYELTPKDFFEVQTKLAEGCMSSAWVLGVVAIHNWQLALFDDRAAQDVWEKDTSVLISSSYMPVGKVERVEGGFKLSGHWGFSSGSKHCEWAFLGAMVPPENPGEAPDYRTFLVPRADYEIVDNWNVMGLQGTGSHDITVKDAFVPEYRTHRSLDGFAQNSPGNETNTDPLFRLPFGQIFVRAVSSSCIGALRGALNDFIAFNKSRVALTTGQNVAQDPIAQKAAADALRVVSELKTVMYSNFAKMEEAVNNGEELNIEDRVQWRYDSAMVADRCADAITQLYLSCGSAGIRTDHQINRAFRDIQTGRTHVANQPAKYANNFGGVTFGRETADFFL
ncbi:flavin-dependent monooxygenase [Endozoicomonas sp. OPT23]|uniref:flavin-dependent monooxygenase n=1 Tax=Endozoicomonas sp. OPT23 TaxID=2072845 RepID=UPI00129A40AD|nr:flavin-dependent monooxygenase [Endozoicomonas sp. OPT23]MRI34027.1 flavin-dependent monooxygenase [Endozoicomonas sp. OPT23]